MLESSVVVVVVVVVDDDDSDDNDDIELVLESSVVSINSTSDQNPLLVIQSELKQVFLVTFCTKIRKNYIFKA